MEKPHWLCRLIGHKWGTWTMDYDCCLRCGPQAHDGSLPYKANSGFLRLKRPTSCGC